MEGVLRCFGVSGKICMMLLGALSTACIKQHLRSKRTSHKYLSLSDLRNVGLTAPVSSIEDLSAKRQTRGAPGPCATHRQLGPREICGAM